MKRLRLTRTVTLTGLLIGALCSLAIVAAVAEQEDGDQPIALAIFDTFKVLPSPAPGFNASFAGVATLIIGPDVVTSTSRMDVKVLPGGNIVHCKFTYVTSDGTLVLASVCVLSQGHGTWRVTDDSTGRFEHFKAVGTETFGRLPAGQVFTDFERFAGIGRFDEHDDD